MLPDSATHPSLVSSLSLSLSLSLSFTHWCHSSWGYPWILLWLDPSSVDHNKLWKILKEMDVPDHFTSLLRNLNAGQAATVRTGHGTVDWFQIRKGVPQGFMFSFSLFNLYAEYIMWNVELDEIQAVIKIARKNINNLKYADGTTLMVEWEEWKRILIKVK